MTINITAFSDAMEGVEYFIHGEGCGGHEHAHGEGPEQYFLKGQQGNPVGLWWGGALEYLGLTAGAEITEADARALFGRLAHPGQFAVSRAAIDAHAEAEGLPADEVEALYAEAAVASRLGSKPYAYKTVKQRVQARLKRERVNVELDPERVRAIELEEAKRQQPKSRNFLDAAFSPTKSTSAYYAGLLAAGRTAEAGRMREIHREAVQEALTFWQREAGFARAGHHGKAPAGQASVGRWVDAHEWAVGLWDHQTNREGEPHLHTHAVILNRVRTVDEDGTEKWRALDGRALFRTKKAAAAIYERAFEQRMEAEFPVAYRMRPDGKARELVGISEAERAALSTRAAQVSEKVEQWAEEYQERTGQAPTAYARTLMQQDAARTTRKRKEPITSQTELLRQWETQVGERLQTRLVDILERAEAAAIEARANGDAEVFERHVVIGQAIERVQERMATWTRADLMWALNEVLPDRLGPSVLAQSGRTTALLEELADEALSGRYGTVMVQGMELIPVPDELRRADGRSIYQPGRDERYATLAHLADEQYVVARAQQRGAEALSQAAIVDALEEAAQGGRPLSDDQVDVVAGVLGDGRPIDVVIGPAGAGKSVAQGVIAQAWQATGRRVIGLGPSSKAAQVLQAEGIGLTMNTTRFLDRAAGRGPRAEVEAAQLRPGDLVILDEAGMASTEHIVKIARMVADVGGKLVLCGDDAQLAAVSAGGLFAELARLGVALKLGTVRRFRNADGTGREWEAKASLGVRDGQLSALDAYLTRGRIKAGAVEDMAAQIQQSYVTDQLRGIHSVIMTATEAQAASLSAAIRADLVALGRVEAVGVDLVDGNVAGVGDLIQARQNVNKLKDSAGMPVYNRYVYRVIERHEDGALSVARVVGRDEAVGEQLGGRVRLSGRYVSKHVTLAYAGTVHSVQGDTVQVGYTLVTSATSREQLYVGLTRGREENRAFVALDQAQDEELLPVLGQVLDNVGGEQSASATLRGALEWIESMGAHAPVWEDLVTEHQRGKHREALREALGAEMFERLEAEDSSTVLRQLWSAELRGHDTRALIAEAVGRGLGDDVETVPSLLHWRIEKRLKERTPETPAAGASWVERTPADMVGPKAEHARARAAAMDARVAALGERAIQAPPQWAVDRLGPVPDDPAQRADWQRRVAAVEAYREQFQPSAPSTVIGPPPSPYMVAQYAAWEAAHQALGRSAEEQRLAEASTASLREQVEIWQREQEWAPPSVADELARVDEQRRQHEQEAALAQAQAALVADEAQRVQLQEQAQQAQARAQTLVGLGAAIEERHAERQAWYERTAALREQADAALAELIRRKADIWDRQDDGPAETVEADRTPEQDNERELSQQEREREAFRRLVQRWQVQERDEIERDPAADADRAPEVEQGREVVAERELSQQEREAEAFARLVEQWETSPAADIDRAPEVEQGREVVAEQHQEQREPVAGLEKSQEPATGAQVLEELREAQARTVAADVASTRERTERVTEQARDVEAAPTLRQQIEAQLAERRAAQERAEVERATAQEIEAERSMQDITRDHHYHQQAIEAEQELTRAAERGPVIEAPGQEW